MRRKPKKMETSCDIVSFIPGLAPWERKKKRTRIDRIGRKRCMFGFFRNKRE